MFANADKVTFESHFHRVTAVQADDKISYKVCTITEPLERAAAVLAVVTGSGCGGWQPLRRHFVETIEPIHCWCWCPLLLKSVHIREDHESLPCPVSADPEYPQLESRCPEQ